MNGLKEINRPFLVGLFVAVLLLACGCSDTLAPSALGNIRVEPETGKCLRTWEGAGTYELGYIGEPSNINLMDIQLRIQPCEREYHTHWVDHDIDLEVGDECLIVSGHVESNEARESEVGMFAVGYDENGKIVAETLDSGRVANCIEFDMEPGHTRGFLLHMNPSNKIQTIQVYGASYIEEAFEPSTPVPESEMTRITFSRDWLLENDHSAGEGTVTITFPASWLEEPPVIPERQETIELVVPTRLLMDHNMSDNPDEIAVTFPAYYFAGLENPIDRQWQ